MAAPLLQAQGLLHRYAGGPCLQFASVNLSAGEHLLLTGPSGSGKSTLLALLCGLLRVQEGMVRLAGTDVAGLSARERDAWRGRMLGFMPQRLHLSEALTVWGNLSLPYVCAGLPVDAPRMQALMQSLGLEGLALRRPHSLSVGQAQRVALARALVRQPALLLADEPTANLDDGATEQVLALLRQAVDEQGLSLVLASHDARVAAFFARSAWPLQRLQLTPPTS